MTQLEELFIEEYFNNHFNASKAFKIASKRHNGKTPTPKSCSANGCRYKKKLNTEIEARKQELKKKNNNNIDDILNILTKALQYDLSNLFTLINGELFIKDSSDWTSLDKLLINSIKQTKNGIEVDMIDKKTAINLLSKYFGLYEGKITENTNDSIFTGVENIDTKYLEDYLKKIRSGNTK